MNAGRIKAFREPRDAQQLFQTLRLFLDDVFELSGSYEMTTWGGTLEFMIGRESVNIVVESLDRDDGFSHVEIRDDELAAFRAWREAEEAKSRSRVGETLPMARLDDRYRKVWAVCLADDAAAPDLECFIADPSASASAKIGREAWDAARSKWIADGSAEE